VQFLFFNFSVQDSGPECSCVMTVLCCTHCIRAANALNLNKLKSLNDLSSEFNHLYSPCCILSSSSFAYRGMSMLSHIYVQTPPVSNPFEKWMVGHLIDKVFCHTVMWLNVYNSVFLIFFHFRWFLLSVHVTLFVRLANWKKTRYHFLQTDNSLVG
jgi:hypothetical protein